MCLVFGVLCEFVEVEMEVMEDLMWGFGRKVEEVLCGVELK